MESLTLAERIHSFWERLDEIKRNDPFPWYPYISLGGLHEFEAHLSPRWHQLLGEGPVLDVCAADGDVSFFVESFGAEVTAVDFAPANYNGMAGIARLKRHLGSNVRILELDIDSRFTLPETYHLTVFMGGLYHLKNPYTALETLARHSRYAIVSTRIARFTPDRSLAFGDAPIAYLLNGDEANADASNFWIFSESGLKRLLERTGWRIHAFQTLGNADSDPSNNDHDERAFCLLESRFTNWRVQPGAGWHAPESGGWRWSERRFSLLVRDCDRNAPTRVQVRFAWHEAAAARLGIVRLAISHYGEMTLETPGEFQVVVELPAGVSVLEMELDKAVPPDPGGDQRELGVILLEAQCV